MAYNGRGVNWYDTATGFAENQGQKGFSFGNMANHTSSMAGSILRTGGGTEGTQALEQATATAITAAGTALLVTMMLRQHLIQNTIRDLSTARALGGLMGIGPLRMIARMNDDAPVSYDIGGCISGVNGTNEGPRVLEQEFKVDFSDESKEINIETEQANALGKVQSAFEKEWNERFADNLDDPALGVGGQLNVAPKVSFNAHYSEKTKTIYIDAIVNDKGNRAEIAREILNKQGFNAFQRDVSEVSNGGVSKESLEALAEEIKDGLKHDALTKHKKDNPYSIGIDYDKETGTGCVKVGCCAKRSANIYSHISRYFRINKSGEFKHGKMDMEEFTKACQLNGEEMRTVYITTNPDTHFRWVEKNSDGKDYYMGPVSGRNGNVETLLEKMVGMNVRNGRIMSYAVDGFKTVNGEDVLAIKCGARFQADFEDIARRIKFGENSFTYDPQAKEEEVFIDGNGIETIYTSAALDKFREIVGRDPDEEEMQAIKNAVDGIDDDLPTSADTFIDAKTGEVTRVKDLTTKAIQKMGGLDVVKGKAITERAEDMPNQNVWDRDGLDDSEGL